MNGTGLILAAMLIAEGSGGRWRAPAEPEPPRGREAGHMPAVSVEAGTCAAFADADYHGAALRLRDGQALEWVGRAWDNRISSVACAPGCRLIGYHHINYGGARANFATVESVGPVFDDRISAARVLCGGTPQGH